MKLALNLPQFMDYRSILERTLLAERLGYHSVWLQDHLWQLRIPDLDHPEAITTMAALALFSRGNCRLNDSFPREIR